MAAKGDRISLKHFSQTTPIVTFQIKCPMDLTAHDALAKARCVPGRDPLLLRIECHKSFECETCSACLSHFAQMFQTDSEPDFFEGPLVPDF